MPNIRSSRVLCSWLLPVVFGALVFKLSVWCGAEGCVPGLRAAARKPHTTYFCASPHTINAFYDLNSIPKQFHNERHPYNKLQDISLILSIVASSV